MTLTEFRTWKEAFIEGICVAQGCDLDKWKYEPEYTTHLEIIIAKFDEVKETHIPLYTPPPHFPQDPIIVPQPFEGPFPVTFETK